MSVFSDAVTAVENGAEVALEEIGQFIDQDVWPEIKQFLTIFTPAEAKSLLGDILGAIPTASSAGIDAAAVQVTTEIGAQTVQNAQTAAQAVLNPPTTGG